MGIRSGKSGVLLRVASVLTTLTILVGGAYNVVKETPDGESSERNVATYKSGSGSGIAFREDGSITASGGLTLGGTLTASGVTAMSGGLKLSSRSVSGSITLTTSHLLTLVDASGTSPSIVTLPAGVANTVYIIKKTDSSANKVQVNADGSEAIDGSGVLLLPFQYDAASIIFDGANWHNF